MRKEKWQSKQEVCSAEGGREGDRERGKEKGHDVNKKQNIIICCGLFI